MNACPHTEPPKLSYIGGQTDAKERLARGEHQRQCPVCGRWIWSQYYTDESSQGAQEADDA